MNVPAPQLIQSCKEDVRNLLSPLVHECSRIPMPHRLVLRSLETGNTYSAQRLPRSKLHEPHTAPVRLLFQPVVSKTLTANNSSAVTELKKLLYVCNGCPGGTSYDLSRMLSVDQWINGVFILQISKFADTFLLYIASLFRFLDLLQIQFSMPMYLSFASF